ncbi:hypothetical protein TUN199_09325 [Pyrenophora tritici-repentis]|nr:hypothetical protein Alg130_08678 [Pyrenophora tritici-repentis]KAI0584341.1 hypothetical protein Alg215_03113 [Pyrenophora tritici-repentis]KAI0614988.1 hypothetical protein TUN205_00702 [Pyrenophora tritici-repentis]KAI0618691.1 hypothetical protein TUN199_09325 [Pyrenophora tritici-repentis]KAI1532375.1 hypothetical protein PtrSN001A_007284 [Pyrenophora tritici-repentis]
MPFSLKQSPPPSEQQQPENADRRCPKHECRWITRDKRNVRLYDCQNRAEIPCPASDYPWTQPSTGHIIPALSMDNWKKRQQDDPLPFTERITDRPFLKPYPRPKTPPRMRQHVRLGSGTGIESSPVRPLRDTDHDLLADGSISSSEDVDEVVEEDPLNKVKLTRRKTRQGTCFAEGGDDIEDAQPEEPEEKRMRREPANAGDLKYFPEDCFQDGDGKWWKHVSGE